MYNTVVVVEGKHDEGLIKRLYPQIEIIKTNGSAINEQTINEIKLALKNSEVILFLDPDGPGEKIRRTIVQELPSCSHAYIKKVDAISANGKKVGIEHAKDEVIRQALNLRLVPRNSDKDITISDLYELKLMGQMNSSKLRNKICNKLSIGPLTSKTFLKRMNLFGVNKNDLIKYLEG